jgi:hypothetical protein
MTGACAISSAIFAISSVCAGFHGVDIVVHAAAR